MDNLGEIWKDVVGYEGLYMVSNLGRVRSMLGRFRGNGILKQTLSGGYPTVSLYKNKKRKNGFVYQLVAGAFLKNKSGSEIAHLDGDKLNNNLTNLRYVSHLENIRHKLIHGTQSRKLTTKQVKDIKLNKLKLKIRELASKYNVSMRTIQSVRSGQYWGWLNV